MCHTASIAARWLLAHCPSARGLIRMGLLGVLIAAQYPTLARSQEKKSSPAGNASPDSTTDKDKPAPAMDPLFDSVAVHRKSKRLADILNLTFEHGLIRMNESHWKQVSLTLPEDPLMAMKKQFGGQVKMTLMEPPTIRLINKLFEGEAVIERAVPPLFGRRRSMTSLATKGLFIGHEAYLANHELRLQTNDLQMRFTESDMMFVMMLSRKNGDVLFLNNTLKRFTLMRSDSRGIKTVAGTTLYELYEKDPQFLKSTIDGLSHLGVGGPFVRIFDPEMRRQVVEALRPRIKSNMDFVEVVSQLGSNEFKVREAATKMLRKHAGEFREQLQQEADNEDNEVELRNRLERVISEWDLSKTAAIQFAEALAYDKDFLLYARKSANDSDKALIDKRIRTMKTTNVHNDADYEIEEADEKTEDKTNKKKPQSASKQ